MKQRLLVLAAAGTVIFAACNGGGNEGSFTQEQLDSISNMKMDSTANALKAQNDSIIQAEAAAEARRADSLRVIDSVINATKKSATKTVAPKKTTTSKPSTPAQNHQEEKKEESKPTEVKKSNSLREQSDQAKQQQGGGSLRNQSDQAKQQQGGGSLRKQSDQAK